MLPVFISLGLMLAGGLIAVGWLHWRGLIRFGQRRPPWGFSTILLGSLQLIAWLLFPGPPDLWLRPLIALTAGGVTAVVALRRARR
jgi:hypothetical protein